MATSAYYVDYDFSSLYFQSAMHVPPSPHKGTCSVFLCLISFGRRAKKDRDIITDSLMCGLLAFWSHYFMLSIVCIPSELCWKGT